MSEISEIKDAVRARDGFCCTDCGTTRDEHIEATGRNLDVHRIIPGSDYSIDGAVSLCRKCHGKRHSGKRNDVPVKIDAHVIKLARLLAAHEDKTMAEVLSEAARSVLMRKLDKLGVPYPPPPVEEAED